MTPERIVEAHVAELRRRNLRPSTIYQRKRVIARLVAWTGDPDPLNVTRHHLEAFFSRPLAPKSLAVEMTHVRQFFEWAVRTGHLPQDPSESFDRPRLPKSLPRPISDAQLTKALDEAPDRIKPWLYLAAYAGLRAAEIAQLRAEAVLMDASPPMLIIEESKGGGMSSVPLHPRLVALFESMDLPAAGYLFERRDGKPGPNAPWLISQRSNEYLHGIGIPDTLHSLRHWFGTNAYRASGRDLRVTQELMRHSSPVTTAGYTYVDPGEAAAAVNQLPAMDTPKGPAMPTTDPTDTDGPAALEAYPPREDYVRVANALARAARELRPLLDEARSLQSFAAGEAHKSKTSDDDDEIESIRETVGVNELDGVLIGFGQIFDTMPLVDHSLHTVSDCSSCLDKTYTV